jgi:hypothetical protein
MATFKLIRDMRNGHTVRLSPVEAKDAASALQQAVLACEPGDRLHAFNEAGEFVVSLNINSGLMTGRW